MLLSDITIVKKTFKGSYSRVKAHLLKLPKFGIQACAKVGDEYQNEMQKLEDVFEESSRRLKKPKLVSLPTDSPTSPNLGSRESSIATNHPFFPKKKGLGILLWIGLLTINVESN